MLAVPQIGSASLMFYSFSGTGIGYLGDEYFNTSYDIILTADTANYGSDPVFGVPAFTDVQGQITLNGIGTATFLDPLILQLWPAQETGISFRDYNELQATGIGEWLGVQSAQLNNTTLTEDIGPISLMHGDALTYSGYQLQTSMGGVFFDFNDFNTFQFQSSSEPFTAVPESPLWGIQAGAAALFISLSSVWKRRAHVLHF